MKSGGRLILSAAMLMALLGPGVSALPPEYRTEFDTLEGSFEFVGGENMIRRQDCWRRPVLFLFLEPGSAASLREAGRFRALEKEHAGRGLCSIAVSTRPASSAEAQRTAEAAPGISVFVANSAGSRLVTRMFVGDAPRLPEVALMDRLGRISYRARGSETDWGQLSALVAAEEESLQAELGHPWAQPNTPDDPSLKERSDFMSGVAKAMASRDFKTAATLALEAEGPKARYRHSDWSRLFDYFYAARAQFEGETSADVERRARSFVKARPRDTAPRVLLATVLAMRGGEVEGEARLRFYREAAAVIDDKTIDMDSNPYSFVVRIGIMANMFWTFEQVAAMVDRGVRRHPESLDIRIEFAKYVSHLETAPGRGWTLVARQLAEIPSRLSESEVFAHIVVPVCFNNFWMAPNCAAKAEELSPDWVLLRDGLLEMLRKRPDSAVNRNTLAWFACLFDDRKTAGQQFEIIGERFEPAVWGNKAAYSFWRRWAARARR